MLIDTKNIDHLYLICGPTDGRKSINGLASEAMNTYRLDPFSNSLFLFCNKKRTVLKVLHWDDNGFELLTKKLSEDKFQWPKDENEARIIDKKQLNWLLDGLSVEQKFRINKVQGTGSHDTGKYSCHCSVKGI